MASAQASLDKALRDFVRAKVLYEAQSLTRPAYDSATTALDTAQANVDVAQADLVSATTRIVGARSQLESTDARIASAQAALAASEAKVTLDQAKNAVAEASSQIILEVNGSFRKLEDSQAYLAVAQLNREAARQKFRVVTHQYREQAALLQDVLAAQAALEQASDQYRQAVLSFWEARADFERPVGSE